MKASDVLKQHQKQCDMDGTEVQVSRQALCEVLDAFDEICRASKNLNRLARLPNIEHAADNHNEAVETIKTICQNT